MCAGIGRIKLHGRLREFKRRFCLVKIAKETGARIAMVSTGPGREETIFIDEFLAELQSMADGKTLAHAKR